MSDQRGILAAGFNGLRRDVAAFALGPEQSPDTVDAALYNDQADIISGRRGRLRIFPNNIAIRGVVPFNFPGKKGNIIADGMGNWGPGTSSPAPAPLAQWAQVKVRPSGSGLTTSTVDGFSPSIQIGSFDMSQYLCLIDLSSVKMSASAIGGNTGFEGVIQMQVLGAAGADDDPFWFDVGEYDSSFSIIAGHHYSADYFPVSGSPLFFTNGLASAVRIKNIGTLGIAVKLTSVDFHFMLGAPFGVDF